MNSNKRWLILGIMWFINFICFLDRINLSVAIPGISSQYNLTPAQSGYLLSAFFVTYTLFQIPGGILADKKDPKGVVSFGLLWWSITTMLTGVTRSFSQLYVFRLLFGIGEGIYPPASMKVVTNWFSDKERATANAIWASANSFGPAFGLPIAVAILSAWGWRALFYIFGAIGLIMVPLWVFLVKSAPEEVIAAQKEAAKQGAGAAKKVSFKKVLSNKNTLLIVIAYFCFLCTFYGLLTWLPSYLVKARGFALIKMGIFAGLPFLALGIGQPIGGWISDKLLGGRRKILIMAATLCTAPSLYAVIASQTETAAMIALVIAGLDLGLVFGPFIALAVESGERNAAGTVWGVVNTGGNIGGIVAPIIIGYLVGSYGYNSAFIFMIIAQLATCLVVSFIPDTKKEIAVTA